MYRWGKTFFFNRFVVKAIRQSSTGNRITEQQLELLKSFKYLTNEKQIAEVKELLHLYHKHKLEAAIEQEERNRNYSAEIYEMWLKTKEGK